MTWLRRVLIGLGALVTAYGIGGVLPDPGVVLFLAAMIVVHDLVWMPVLLGVGAVVTGAIARFAGLVAASVLVVGVPLVVAVPPADNPSVLPLGYGRNLLAVLAGIAVVAAPAAGWRCRRTAIAVAAALAARWRRGRKGMERTAGPGDR